MKYIHIFLLILFITQNSNIAQCQSINNDESISVLSWNIHMLPGTIYHATKKVKRAKLISEEFIKRDYDILVIQEAFHFRTRRILKKKLKDKYPYISKPLNFRFFSFRTNGGVWVLSKIKIEELNSVKFDIATGSSRWARKGAVLFQGEVKGVKFQLLGTHTNGGSVNDRQFQMIYDELIKPYKLKGITQIICGDLNCTYENKTEYQSMLNILDAEDTPRNGDFTYSNHEKTSVIDYILIRKNESTFNQVSKKIILIGSDWEVGKRKYPETVGLSDHMPLELYFKINP